jgi:hypothetical protein
MKVSMNPQSLPMQEMQYLKTNGSYGAQVQRLMKQVERETMLLKAGDAMIHNAEEFPNHVHNNQTDRMRRLLDVI